MRLTEEELDTLIKWYWFCNEPMSEQDRMLAEKLFKFKSSFERKELEGQLSLLEG